LLGIVIGEPLGGWILTRSINVAHAASVCIVGERYDKQAPSTASAAISPEHGSFEL
jgi:hypothetical protein